MQYETPCSKVYTSGYVHTITTQYPGNTGIRPVQILEKRNFGWRTSPVLLIKRGQLGHALTLDCSMREGGRAGRLAGRQVGRLAGGSERGRETEGGRAREGEC